MMVYRSWIKSKPLPPSQSFGDTHWDSFAETRKKHNENICLETNKLVLRLDKLINSVEDGGGGGGPSGGKVDLDKSIVEWTEDNLVKLCPFCAKQFTFARRRHHCRACGAILCSGCSKFLEYKAACRLVKPVKLYTDAYDRIEDRLLDQSIEDVPSIRCCEDCKRLLDKRIQTIEDYYCQPTFHEFYEKLRRSMEEADELMLAQDALVNEQQKPPDAELKEKIQTVKHKVAPMSSKLGKMVERESSGKQAHLLSAINQSVAYWLKEPMEAKYKRIMGKRRAEGPTGWVPEQPLSTPELVDELEDPLLIQIRNLEGYIRQARLAGRYEEVGALEQSKRDLEIEHLIQRGANSCELKEEEDGNNS